MNNFTPSEIQLICDIEQFIMDFDNNKNAICQKLRGVYISLDLGMQLIYADSASPFHRLRRMVMFVIMLNESSNLQTDWTTAYQLLKDAYIMTDNIYAQMMMTPYAFDLSSYLLEMKKHISPLTLMLPEEMSYYNALPQRLTAYRGMCNAEYESQNYGVSWSDKIEIAKNYVFYKPNNNTSNTGKIACMAIDRSVIFAVWGVKGKEKELIIPHNP